MEILNTFIEQASNIWWGIVAAVVVIGTLYLIIYIIQGGSKSFSPLGFLFAVPLLPLLAFQFYLLFGAVSVKHKCSEIAIWIDAVVPIEESNGIFSREEIDETLKQLVVVFPLAASLIDPEDISIENGNTLGEALTHKITSYLNWYIVRRVAWSVGFIVIAFGGVVLIQSQSSVSYHRERREHRHRPRPARRNRR